jgi:hypothetical protein
MKTSIKIILLILLTNNLYSQGRLFVGGGLSICHDYSEIFDPKNHVIMTQRPPSMMFSIDVRRGINETFYLESGIYFKGLSQGFGFSGYGTFWSSAIPSINVPVRLIPKIEILKGRLYCNPLIGISFGYNSNYGQNSYGGGDVATMLKGDTISTVSFQYDDEYEFRKFYTLFQIGVSLEYVFRNKSRLQFQSSYYSGQQKVVQTNISYQMNKEARTNAMITSNGSFWQVLGVTYLFSMHSKTSVADGK